MSQVVKDSKILVVGEATSGRAEMSWGRGGGRNNLWQRSSKPAACGPRGTLPYENGGGGVLPKALEGEGRWVSIQGGWEPRGWAKRWGAGGVDVRLL